MIIFRIPLSFKMYSDPQIKCPCLRFLGACYFFYLFCLYSPVIALDIVEGKFLDLDSLYTLQKNSVTIIILIMCFLCTFKSLWFSKNWCFMNLMKCQFNRKKRNNVQNRTFFGISMLSEKHSDIFVGTLKTVW